jgi:hypothetical protein
MNRTNLSPVIQRVAQLRTKSSKCLCSQQGPRRTPSSYDDAKGDQASDIAHKASDRKWAMTSVARKRRNKQPNRTLAINPCCPKTHRRGSCGLAVTEVEKPAEARATGDLAVCLVVIRRTGRLLDQLSTRATGAHRVNLDGPPFDTSLLERGRTAAQRCGGQWCKPHRVWSRMRSGMRKEEKASSRLEKRPPSCTQQVST